MMVTGGNMFLILRLMLIFFRLMLKYLHADYNNEKDKKDNTQYISLFSLKKKDR